MAGIYIYSDRKDLVAELIGFAKGSGKSAFVLTINEESAEAVKNLGADKVYLLKGESPAIENYGKAIAGFLQEQEADLFAVGATARGRDIAARVAGYLDSGMVSDAFALSYLDGKLSTERLAYGGAVIQSNVLTGLSVVTVPTGKFDAAPAGLSEVESVKVQADTRVQVTGKALLAREGVDITAAERIVCVGMGLGKAEDLKIAQSLADTLGAEIGCSRGVAEERHFLPVENYIGITGATVKPSLYLSLGVSGQVQHTVGIRDAKVIVAIDINEKAPIFKTADYGIVGDLYEIAPLLTEALQKV